MRDEFLNDCIVNAVESGGITYWADVCEYMWDDTDGMVALAEIQVDDTGERYTLDADVINLGIERIRSGEVQINRTVKSWILLGDAENDAAEIDSLAADCIVQAGVLGDIVYG